MTRKIVPPQNRIRALEGVLRDHFERHRQMAFLTGPRQVGKTTLARVLAKDGLYLNWDDPQDRRIILAGPERIAAAAGLERLSAERLPLVFDELHKFPRWRALLKGLFDSWGNRTRILVTGSSRLDVYRRGGDSLMGRYFPFRMHPFSVGEIVRPRSTLATEIAAPIEIDSREWSALLEHGGYPEPFVRRAARFTRRWNPLRRQQLVREDIRDATRVQEIAQLETLAEVLQERSAQALVLSNLAPDLGLSVDTVRRWVEILTSFHFGFLLRPWTRNVAKALRKEPKWYCLDWSAVEERGPRIETLVACHLLKAVHAWQDAGLGSYELRYLRDKNKREVDFLVVKNRKPWFLVEAKASDASLSPQLAHFHSSTGAAHAFQAVADLAYVQADCFARRDPCVVPLRTLLSQLP